MYDMMPKDTHVYEFVSSHMYDMRSKNPHMHDMIALTHMHDMIALTHMLWWWRGRKDHSWWNVQHKVRLLLILNFKTMPLIL